MSQSSFTSIGQMLVNVGQISKGNNLLNELAGDDILEHQNDENAQKIILQQEKTVQDMKPVQKLVQRLNIQCLQQKFAGKVFFNKQKLSQMVTSLHITLRLDDEFKTYCIQQLLPDSTVCIKSQFPSSDIDNTLDIICITKQIKNLKEQYIFDIIIHLKRPIQRVGIQQAIGNFAKDLSLCLQSQFNVEFDDKTSTELSFKLGKLSQEDFKFGVKQSYIRGLFFQKCLSLVQYPDDIILFYVNESNTIENLHNLYNLDDEQMFLRTSEQAPYMMDTSSSIQTVEPKKRDTKSQRKKELNFMKFDSFKNSDNLWSILQNTFQHQEWLYLSSIILAEQEGAKKHSQGNQNNANLFQSFPQDYWQIGFVDPNITHESFQETDSIDCHQSEKQLQMQTMHYENWKRNKSVGTIVRLLTIQTVNQARLQPALRPYLEGVNFRHIIQKGSTMFHQEICQHNQISFKEVIHPHPCVSLKESLYQGFTLQIDEPFFLGPLYSLSIINACQMIGYQLFCSDKQRKCDSGAIMLCGESRSGKSVLLDSIGKLFGGYEWQKTQGNFQGEQIQQSSICTVEEIEIECLKTDSKFVNMWKKRLDQTISVDIDVKSKQGFQCLKHVPFILTTNKKPYQIRHTIDNAFHKRINSVYFPHQIVGIADKLQSEHVDSWISRKNEKSEQAQKQMTVNMLMLVVLFFGHLGNERKNFYYVDDLICEHIIKVLISNRDSVLLYMFLRPMYLQIIKDAIMDFQCHTNFQREHQQQNFATPINMYKFLSLNSQPIRDFTKMYMDLFTDGEFTLNSINDMNINIVRHSSSTSHFTFTSYENVAELKTKIKQICPESNMKRHMLRIWDNVVERLGM